MLLQILKRFFDAGEVISGVIMLFMTPKRMSKLIAIITKEELQEDPRDIVMNYLVSYSHIYSFNTQQFTSFYLLTHGIVKIIFLLLLWNKKLWAYPISCIMFLGFTVMQLQRFAQTHSIMLIVVTVVDVLMLILTLLEYSNIRKNNLS